VSSYAGADTAGTTTLLGRVASNLPNLAAMQAGLPSVSAIATYLYQDTTAGDFTMANSPGYWLLNYLTGNAYTRLGAPAGASVSADIAANLAGITGVPAALLTTSVDGNLTLKQMQAVMFAMQTDAIRTWNAGTLVATDTWYRRVNGSTASDPTRPIVVKTTQYAAGGIQVLSVTTTFSNLP
jgi:hypothetical protein